MRVLLLTQWFDPEPTFKGLTFAKHLQKIGHDVTVLTGFPNYPGGRLYDGYSVRPRQVEYMEGVQVLRVPLYPSHDGSAPRRIANYVSFAISAAIATTLIPRPDVAYVYHPPATVALPAMVLKWLRNVPFVYDVQDLWPDSLAATGMLSQRHVLHAVGRAMRIVYRGAARVVVLSDGFRRRILDQGLGDEHVVVIPNWADEEKLTIAKPDRSRLAELGLPVDPGTLTITFAGNIGPAQALDVVLDAAFELREAPVQLVIVGGGIDRDRMRGMAETRGLSNVTFLARRPVSEIGEVLAASDALLVHLRDDPLFEITIPSKIQAYLLAGRPLIVGVRGDAARLVELAAAGIVFAPESVEGLVRAIRSLLDLDTEARTAMGVRGRAYYDAHLSLAVGAGAFDRVLQDAANVRPWTLAAKRAGDVAFATALLILSAAPAIGVAVVVRRWLGSPVLFRQRRPGRFGRPFTMLKFRTMTDARDDSGTLLHDADRLTSLGAFLRRSSLDEIPSLINVIKGDMSLVGPRPLLDRYTQWFTTSERQRLHVRPGITGLAQVRGRNLVRWDDRLAADVEYVRNLTVRQDLRILLATARQVLRRTGAVADPESIMRNLDDERRAQAPRTR